jgi:hypothetical protein
VEHVASSDTDTDTNIKTQTEFLSEGEALAFVLSHYKSGIREWEKVYEDGILCMWTVMATKPESPESPCGIYLFMILRFTPTSRFVVRFLSENAGPYFYSCPPHLLKKCSPTANSLAFAWRKHIAKLAAASTEK